MKKLQFISKNILIRLDRLSFLLSFLYLLFYFLHDRASEYLQAFIILSLLSLTVYFAKSRNKVMYAALGYALFFYLFLTWSIIHWELSFTPYFIIVPLGVFIGTMLLEWNSNFISGILYGHWIVIVYTFIQFIKEKSFLESLEQSFSTDIIQEQFMLIVMIGVIVGIVGETGKFDFNGYWIEKIDYTWFLLGFGYLYSWFVHDWDSIYIITFGIYIVLSHFSLTAKASEKRIHAAIAYGGVTFIIIHWLTGLFFKENYYVPVLISIVIFLIILKKNLSTNFLTGVFCLYWLSLFAVMMKSGPTSFKDTIQIVYQFDSIQALQAEINIIGIAFAIYAFIFYMLKLKKK